MKTRIQKLNNYQILVMGFMSILVIGGCLLSLPIASQSGNFTNFWDAFFTSASALFVTGQTTLNIANHFNAFGKSVILLLIQIGGLGFMTFIVLFIFMMGKKVTLKDKKVMSEALNIDDISQIKSLVRYVLGISMMIQAIGALLLSFKWIPEFGLLKGLLFSIFHAISAFNNAGFDLFGNSLISYQDNTYVLTIIMLLIFTGGLGFIVWRDLFTYHKNKKLLVHTRVVLSTTMVVILVSFILVAIAEFKHGTFNHLPLKDQIVNTLFLVITPRTAGFSNIDYRLISKLGIFMTIMLMFIGGASGSTAGGFKVNTLVILYVTLISFFRNEEPHLFKRSLQKDQIRKAFVLLFISTNII
ncbi:MAG TPA: potassium transporter TrkG, partial [Erysipelothrix sp.]|nr:potassium transporter TrkG [Erysipelothrix sp.]